MMIVVDPWRLLKMPAMDDAIAIPWNDRHNRKSVPLQVQCRPWPVALDAVAV